MRPILVTSPLLTLSYDDLNEVSERLPAVGSPKPWRDLQSLAITCMRLYQWKKTIIDINVESEWKRITNEVAMNYGALNALQVILNDFGNPARRLFREPLLREITRDPEPLTTAKPIKSVNEFNASAYLNRETLSLYEIRLYLRQSVGDKLEKKLQLIEKLPSFLPNLKSLDRQTVLRLMFKSIDKDRRLVKALNKKTTTFAKIIKSLGDDQESKTLLEISLYSRSQYLIPISLSQVENGLKHVPEFERWDWINHGAPEFLNTNLGLQVILNDSVCRTQMINHLNKEFLECEDDDERIDFFEKVATVSSCLCECRDGKNLTKKLVHWFLKGPIFTEEQGGIYRKECMQLLMENITLVKNYFGKKEQNLLSKYIFKIIAFSIRKKLFDQVKCILTILAKEDIKLFKKFIVGHTTLVGQQVLKDLLSHAAFRIGVENRLEIISILREASKSYILSDPEFFIFFRSRSKKYLEQIPQSIKKPGEDDIITTLASEYSSGSSTSSEDSSSANSES